MLTRSKIGFSGFSPQRKKPDYFFILSLKNMLYLTEFYLNFMWNKTLSFLKGFHWKPLTLQWESNGFIKIVPLNIFESLTAIGLAFWIMDDGSYNKIKSNIIFYIDSYTLQEIQLQINGLNNKFNLSATRPLRLSLSSIILSAFLRP